MLITLKEKGYDVYDREIPPENTPYPFIYMGDFLQADESMKGPCIGEVSPSIYIYGLLAKRGSVSKLALEIKELCHKLRRTEHFRWRCKDNISQSMTKDYEGSTPLIQCLIEPIFIFS